MPRRHVVWDCATGNGQAAKDLARYFDRVVATDASADQIAHAIPVENVEYRVAPAESSGLPKRSVDAVTVAQALHWFAHESFFSEVRRVTLSGGLVAAWSYGSAHAGADVERILREFEDGTVGAYWSPERRWVDEHYETIPFPFEEIAAPAFELHAHWTLSQLGAYLNSWSAVSQYKKAVGADPVPSVLEQLAERWNGADERRDVMWPLHIRIGRVE